MKDAYSFHADERASPRVIASCTGVLAHIHANRIEVQGGQADGGGIGGTVSQEFHVLADSGEDAIVFSNADDYAANLEMAATVAPAAPRPAATEPLTKVSTPNARTIADVAALLQVDAARCVKTLLVDGSDGDVVALVIRGDHELNALKAQKLPGVASPLRMSSAERVRKATGTEPGFIGPIGFAGRIYADYAAAHLADFVCGANEMDTHFRGANWGRDLTAPQAADIRNALSGDPVPAAAAPWRSRAASSGHIFQLGQLYE
jgi:prolyl-tRNA synthetase